MLNDMTTFRPHKGKWEVTGQYYIHNTIEKTYQFIDTDLAIILSNIKNIKNEEFEINDVRDNTEYKVDLNFNSPYTPRPEQEKYIRDIVDNTLQSNRYLIDLEPGGGKTFLSCFALGEIGERFLIYIKAEYIAKWIGDVKGFFGLSDEEIYIITGMPSLRKIANGKVDIDKIKIFITSTQTMGSYFKAYLNGELEDGIPRPEQFLKTIKTNVMLVDEAHQHFMTVFNGIVLLSPRYQISLSATLLTYDKKLMSIYNKLYPDKLRLSYSNFKPYVTYIAMKYTIGNFRNIRFKRGSFGYSHIEYEKSLMRNRILLNKWMDMVLYNAKKYYINRRKKGQKLLIFVNTVKLAEMLSKFLNVRLRSFGLQIGKYTGEEPYSYLMENDISVSTLLSAGTAVDIKGLITVLDTVNTDSLQSNLQSLGRLREDKKEHTEMIYVQFICNNIRQHSKYYGRFRTFLATRAKKLKEEQYKDIL
jgi:superfamily II DNA or RNA helicase